MKSLNEYLSKNTGYYNSLQASLIDNVYLGENLFIHRGKDIDSIFYKLNIYEYRSTKGSYIHENYKNVDFDIDEQFAARDMMINIAESYATNLCEDFLNKYNIEINEALTWKDIKDGTKNFINNISNKVNEYGNEIKKAYDELKSALKPVYEFIKKVINKAIKSAKELVNLFIEMMEHIQKGADELLEMFGGDIDNIQNELKVALDEAAKNKNKRPKENIYENLGLSLKYGDNLNESLFGFGKNNDKSNKNEYSEAENASNNSSNTKQSNWKKIVLGILKQILISVVVLIVIPAICSCAWGGAVGLVVATIAKAVMSGYAFWKLIKNIKNTLQSDNWKKYSKIRKCLTIVMWILMLGLIAWGIKGFASDSLKILEAWQSNTFDKLVPDAVVQKCAEIINDIWKSITGSDSTGYTDIMNIVNNGVVKIEEITDTKVTNQESIGDKSLEQKLTDGQYNRSIEEIKDAFTHKLSDDAVREMPTDRVIKVLMDGHPDASHWTNAVKQAAEQGIDLKNVDIQTYLNKSLNSINANAGSMYTIEIPAGDYVKLIDAGVDLGNKNIHAVIGAAEHSSIETVTNIISKIIPAISGSFVPIVAMPSIIKKYWPGDFNLRMGSSRTGGYDIYKIKKDNGYKTMTFGKILQKYNDNNPTAIEKMKNLITDRHNELLNIKNTLEGKKDITKEEKKALKKISKHLDKMKDSINNYECTVFLSDIVIENNEVKEGLLDKLFNRSKGKEKEVNYKPVMFFNTLTMQCCDLTDQRSSKKEGGKSKGPRKNPIPVKGLFSSYEFLPVENGAAPEAIIEFLVQLFTESIKYCYNISLDAPFIKEGKNYVINSKSNKKGERKDFGNFTNEEIVKIMNDPNEIAEFMRGKYKKGHTTLEKENTELEQERRKNAKQEWKNEIENNEKIKDLINNSKTLKNKLVDKDGKVNNEELDKLTDLFLRIENNYKSKKSKKSFWSKLKSLFSNDKDKDIEDNYDQNELRNLAFRLADIHNKNLNKRKNKIEETNEELYIGEYNDICERLYIFNYNMYLFENEENILENYFEDLEYYKPEF